LSKISNISKKQVFRTEKTVKYGKETKKIDFTRETPLQKIARLVYSEPSFLLNYQALEPLLPLNKRLQSIQKKQFSKLTKINLLRSREVEKS
jgi:hypothetical protein